MKGGIAVAAGPVVAGVAWLTAVVLRRRQAAAGGDRCPPADPTQRTEPADTATVGDH